MTTGPSASSLATTGRSLVMSTCEYPRPGEVLRGGEGLTLKSGREGTLCVANGDKLVVCR